MRVRPTLSHVAFQSSRLAEMRDWYVKLLDGEVVFEGNGLCFITNDTEHHRVALIEMPDLGRKRLDQAYAHHSSFTVSTLDELLDSYVDLKSKGLEPYFTVQHGVTTSLYYRDPDGTLVELQVDNFASPEEATAYMQGAEFAGDPSGPAFDPEKMIEARREGVDATVLQTRAWTLQASPDLKPALQIIGEDIAAEQATLAEGSAR